MLKGVKNKNFNMLFLFLLCTYLHYIIAIIATNLSIKIQDCSYYHYPNRSF